MRNILLSSVVASVVTLWCVPSVLADTYLYNLNNHPDGNAADPEYGFRLDELKDISSDHDIWTFDFNHAESSMFLEYDNSDTASLDDDTVGPRSGDWTLTTVMTLTRYIPGKLTSRTARIS